MDKRVTLITEIMVNEKIKENFVWLMCVGMRGYENVRVKSTRTMSFSSSLHVGWVWWPWALGRVTIPSVCWVCSQHCAEFSHGAGDVRENLFVARNYRWIYLDFLLGVVKFLHGCWGKELEVGPWCPSFPSCLCCVHGSGVWAEFCTFLLRDSTCFNVFPCSQHWLSEISLGCALFGLFK